MAEPEVQLSCERQPTDAYLHRLEWVADDNMARRLELEHGVELGELQCHALGLLIEAAIFQVTDSDTDLQDIIRNKEELDDDWDGLEISFFPD